MPKLTEEERKEHRRIATARYRLKKGVAVGTKRGRPASGYTKTVDNTGVVPVVREEPVFIKPKKRINHDSTFEERLDYIMEICDNLVNCPNPAAWASGGALMHKALETMIKLAPPKTVEPVKRPRVEVVIQDDEPKEDEE